MYCNNPENERHIWTWAECSFEERVRKWELPSKWYEHIEEFKKVFGKILIQFPKHNKETANFKQELTQLFADFYLEPVFNNDYGNDCCLVYLENVENLKNDCETRLLNDNEFYYSELGQLELNRQQDTYKTLEHLRNYFQSNYELTPRYFVERYRISEEEASKTKSDIYQLAKNTVPDYVKLVAHRELESKIELQKDQKHYRITIIHKNYSDNREILESLLENPKPFENSGIRCREAWLEKDEKIDVDEETKQIAYVEYESEFLLLNFFGVPRPVKHKRCDVASLNPLFWEISYSRK